MPPATPAEGTSLYARAKETAAQSNLSSTTCRAALLLDVSMRRLRCRWLEIIM